MAEQSVHTCGLCGSQGDANIITQPVRVSADDIKAIVPKAEKAIEPGAHVLCKTCHGKAREIYGARLKKKPEEVGSHDML